MGDQLKEASFTMLVLLVAISGVFEFTQVKPAEGETGLDMSAVGNRLGVGAIKGFEAQTLVDDFNGLAISGENILTSGSHIISTVALTEIPQFIGSLISFFLGVWNIGLKLLFGWISLLNAIFSSIKMQALSIVFIAPIAVIEIVGLLYFLRDIVNTIRGAG